MFPWSYLWSALGVATILIVSHDFLRTVLTVSGGGPVSGRLNALVWRGALHLHRRRPSHASLSWVGPLLAFGTLLLWAGALWLGWTLVFCASPDAVVDADSGAPAGFVERVYFVGYTLTTLGLGDFEPDATVWRIATVLAAANGLFLFTMAITYIVPIVGATAVQRQLASTLDGLGDDPADIVRRSWEGDSLDSLRTHLTSVTPLVHQIRQQYLAYPILHYFHSPDTSSALPLRLAVLDETVMLLACAVRPSERLPTQVLMPLRGALDSFLDTLEHAWIEPADEAPSSPALQELEREGIPTVPPEEFAERLAERADQRRRLLGLVRSDGWEWRAVLERRGRGHD